MGGVANSIKVKREIAALLAAGVSASEISRDYQLAVSTIKNFPKELARLDAKAAAYRAAKASVSASLPTPAPKSAGDFFETAKETANPQINPQFKSFRIAVIPDCQVKPGVDISHLPKIGQYLAEKRPDVVVCIGDFADMPSHSFHDEPGSKSFSAQNYKDDILSVHLAMKALMEPIQAVSDWKPRLVMTLGNHENRILRTLEKIPKLDGTIGIQDLEYERWGWEVIPFLKPIIIEGIAFCHYFQTGQMGRPASSARAILNKQHMSCFAGHQQGRDIAYGKRGDGREMTAIICGSCYLHDEDYLSPQTNNHFRGIYMLNDVQDGQFEEMPVSLRYLMRR